MVSEVDTIELSRGGGASGQSGQVGQEPREVELGLAKVTPAQARGRGTFGSSGRMGGMMRGQTSPKWCAMGRGGARMRSGFGVQGRMLKQGLRTSAEC